jgi:hypothetical protein
MSDFWKPAYPESRHPLTENVMRVTVEHPDVYGDLSDLSVVVHVVPYGIRVDGENYWTRDFKHYFPAVTNVEVKGQYCTFELGYDETHFIQAKADDDGLIIDYWRGEECVDSLGFLWNDFLEDDG